MTFLAIPIWIYFVEALVILVLCVLAAAGIWVLVRRFRRRVLVPIPPQMDPDYPVKRRSW